MRPNFTKFPVLFPVSWEFGSRDRFDHDCIRHHAVLSAPKVSDAVTKVPNLRAFAGLRAVRCGLRRSIMAFRLLYGLLFLGHGHRKILWLGATAHRSTEWISRQLTEAYGWEQGPHYLVRDQNRIYGDVFIRRLRAMGIRDRPTVPRSSWQNGYCERLIGSIRRDCFDHVVVFGERYLRRLFRFYERYYNQTRTHLSLDKDSPMTRSIETVGRILPLPILGGLHHRYVRI
jgi:transposase InsO family protein